jgi:hypothetical protein
LRNQLLYPNNHGGKTAFFVASLPPQVKQANAKVKLNLQFSAFQSALKLK